MKSEQKSCIINGWLHEILIYNIEFVGRKTGAIGIIYKINDKIEASTEAEFVEKLYKKYEHVSKLKINGKFKNL